MDTDSHALYVAKIKAWIDAYFAQMRAAGATDEDLAEPAFKQMMGEAFCAWYKGQFAGTPEAWNFMWDEFMRSGTPDDLRMTAERLRAVGDHNSAYPLECLADERERGTSVH
jgi:hypothetical protein